MKGCNPHGDRQSTPERKAVYQSGAHFGRRMVDDGQGITPVSDRPGGARSQQAPRTFRDRPAPVRDAAGEWPAHDVDGTLLLTGGDRWNAGANRSGGGRTGGTG